MAEILTDEIDFSEYLRETDAKSKVKPASAWMLELIDRLKNPDQTKKVFLPWENSGSYWMTWRLSFALFLKSVPA